MERRAQVVAENEAVFRKVNEHHVAGRPAAETFEIFCECADTGCSDRILVPNETYERARQQPTDFLLKAEHVKSEFEIVIESYDDFVLARKMGEAAVVATRLFDG
jgi:hypothetical protein